MEQQWLVNVIDYSLPSIEDPTLEQARLLELWSKYFPRKDNDGEGDFEDFFEQAYRLDSALSSFGKNNVNLITSWGSGKCSNADTCVTYPVSAMKNLPRYGAQEKSTGFVDSSNPSIRSENLADRYHFSESFNENSGRLSMLTGMNAEGQDIFQTVLDMAMAGVKKVFIKATSAKKGVWVIDLPESLDYDQAYKLLMNRIDWTLIRYEGSRDAFSVQEFITMDYEYRLFVVDGEVVTGAGCVEEHTPLDNNGSNFDTKVRKNRNARSDIEDRADLVAKLVEFGRDVARKMSDEEPNLIGYVIDVAFGSDGKPLVIERNCLLNAGLYANKNVLVTDALKRFDFGKFAV